MTPGRSFGNCTGFVNITQVAGAESKEDEMTLTPEEREKIKAIKRMVAVHKKNDQAGVFRAGSIWERQ